MVIAIKHLESSPAYNYDYMAVKAKNTTVLHVCLYADW